MIQIDLGNTRGIKRKVDDNCRVIIPSNFLKEIGVEDEAEIFLVEEGIYIRKPE